MATKQFYATGDFKYGTRMLRAGDGPFPMTAPQARLYRALGKITDDKPKGTNKVLTGPDVYNADRLVEKPAKAAAKRKRTRKAKK